MQENFIVHPKYEFLKSELKDFLNNFSQEGSVVAKGNRNEIRKITLNGEDYTVKKFKVPGFFQSLVYQYIRKSKAKRSYEYAMKLISFGINTPFPVAYFEQFSSGLKESYYICRHIDYDFDFRVLIHQRQFENRKIILQQFATFTYTLHEAGVNFLDHSPGNTLIVKEGDTDYTFYLIDLNRMRFESMSFEKRMHNFRRLWVSRAMIKIIAQKYAELYPKDFDTTYKVMQRYSKAFQDKTNLKKRRRRKRKKS